MYLVVIGWGYVALMMAITEDSVIAGIMTFLIYGALPLSIILYLSGGRRRREKRALTDKQALAANAISAERERTRIGDDQASSMQAEETPEDTKYPHK
jgi:hypothetical protein